MTVAYRLCSSRYRPNSGKGAALYGGRWNRIGLEAIYAAESRALSALETLVHYAVLPRNYVVTEIHIPDRTKILQLADFFREFARYPGTLRKDYIAFRERRASLYEFETRMIGSRWFETGVSAVLCVPSVIIPEERNYVFNVGHSDFKNIKFLPSKPFFFDPRLRPGHVTL